MSPTRKSYESTEVPVSKSQDELRGLLLKFGARQFSFGEGRDWAGVEFVHADHMVRVRCPLKPPTDAQIKTFKSASHITDSGTAVMRLLDREAMRVWRVLVWTVKARLVAVEEGLETFEQSFLAHIVDPSTDRTIWQAVRDPIESGVMRLGGPGWRALGSGNA